MKLGEEEIGFCLRFTVPETKRNNTDLNDFKQSSTKLIMYDILKLNFVRTNLVTHKKNPNEEYFSQLKNMTPTITTVDANTEVVHKKGKKNKNKKKNNNEQNYEENEEEEYYEAPNQNFNNIQYNNNIQSNNNQNKDRKNLYHYKTDYNQNNKNVSNKMNQENKTCYFL